MPLTRAFCCLMTLVETQHELNIQFRAECPAVARLLLSELTFAGFCSGSCLGDDSPFFSTIVLFQTGCFRCVFDGFLKRRMSGKNGELK